MLDDNAKELIKQGDHLYTKRESLLSLWQEIALNFYPERADFTVTRTVGDEFADHLTTSYPILARRDLGNSFSSMLRKDNWFQIGVKREPDGEGKAWLDWATGVQRRAMYDRTAQFKRATKEGDHDFAAFGQCGLSVELNSQRDGFLYRNWHLRDLAWCEGPDGSIDTVHLKWRPTARTLMQLFGDKCSDKVKQRAEKSPYSEISCRRIVVLSENYESYGQAVKRPMTPFMSIYIDVENAHIMQEMPLRLMPFVIPRWQTVSGSQYAYSPATVAALPDARLIQAMTLSLLDAGEKASDPPMLAVGDAIRGDVDLRAGGITWVDAEYDERMGDVLRPLTVDKNGIPMGLELTQGVREMITEAFYLNKLSLPISAGDMTATEVSQRVQEYIRQALPLFEPMEEEYNAAICENTFILGLNNGLFGGDLPDSLRRQQVEFKFISPLRAAVDREKGTRMGEALNLTTAAIGLDPTAVANVDVNQMLRDALEGIGVPARWVRDEDDAAAEKDKIQQEQRAAKLAALAGQLNKPTPAALGAQAETNASTQGVGGAFQ